MTILTSNSNRKAWAKFYDSKEHKPTSKMLAARAKLQQEAKEKQDKALSEYTPEEQALIKPWLI